RPAPPRAGPDNPDEATDGDAPDPRRRLTPPVPGRSALPDGHERVLHGVGHGFAVGAAATEPDGDPDDVAVVQLPECPAVAVSDGREQLPVGPHGHARYLRPAVSRGPRRRARPSVVLCPGRPHEVPLTTGLSRRGPAPFHDD